MDAFADKLERMTTQGIRFDGEYARLVVFFVYPGASDQARLSTACGWNAPGQCTSYSKGRRGVCLDGRSCSRREERASKIDGATMPGAGNPSAML